MSGYSIDTRVKCVVDRHWVGTAPDPNAVDFGTEIADNSTYTEKAADGSVISLWKYEADSVPPAWCGPLESDDDIEAVNASLVGTDLSFSVTESGIVQTSNTLDLSPFLDDTDISGVDVSISGTDLTVGVTEDGVTVDDTVDLSALADTDVSGVTLRAGPNDTDKRPTIEAVVTEDGVDVVSNEWPLATICPDEMTRAALLALRNAGELCKDCHYVITDPGANGTLQLQKVLMHAVDERTLSGCYLKVAHDNTAWNGAYDIDTNQVRQVFDHLYDNEVSGNAAVITFPWGVAAVTDVEVNEGRLNYTAGTIRGLEIGHNSTVNMIGGILRESVVAGDSDLTIRSGDNYELRIDNSSNLNQVGTGFIRRTTVANESNVTVGNASMNDNVFERTIFNSTGSAGSVNYNRFHRSSITISNIPTLRLDSCAFAANSQVTANAATRFDVRYGTFSGYARLLVSAGRSLFSQYDGIRDYGYIQVLNGFLTSRYNSVSNVGYIQHNTPGSNTIDSVAISSRARARFLGTSTGCRIYYSSISSGSYIEHQGTSTNCYVYYSEVGSLSNIRTNNSVNSRIYYNTVHGNSELYAINVTGTHYIYYCACTGHGYIRFENAPGGRLYAVSCHGQGLLRFRPANGNGRLYYSSFTAYYYLYANGMTATRHSLHGYGRKTRTTTGNMANGTPTENF